MTLRTQLLLGLAYPVLVAIVSLAVPLAVNVHQRVEAQVKDRASAQAATLAAAAASPAPGTGLQALADEGARRARGRVVIVDRTGRLLADSARSAPAGTSFTSREEVRRAVAGERVQLERDSRTLGAGLLATATPVVVRGRPDGAVRITQSTAAVGDATRRVTVGIAALAGIVLLLGLALAVVLSSRLARPTRRLQEAAQAVAAGRLGTTVPPEGAREHRALAEAFNTMSGRVEEMVEAQRRFVADASHQLRTPLTGTRLHLEGVRDARDLQEARAGAAVALREVDRLARTVDELLELSREQQHPDGGPRRTPVALGPLAREAARRWAPAADAAEQAIVVEERAPGSVPAVREDVERALDALIENALRYAPAGATCTLLAAGRTITVLDEGPGLTDDDLARVFDRFHRGSASDRASGSGLGLPIARSLARRHGGDVRLARRPDGPGTAATLDLAGA